MLAPTIQGGGTIRYPVPQNATMNLRKSPIDMNSNRNEKLVQISTRGGGGGQKGQLRRCDNRTMQTGRSAKDDEDRR